MILRFKSLVLFTFVFIFCAVSVTAQQENKAAEKKEDKPQSAGLKGETAEQDVETTILFYGNFGGREVLDRIRKTTVERGRITLTNADGTVDKASYERWIIRSGNLDKERVRLDQQYPNTRYSLIYDGEKTFGVFNNNTVFAPKEDVSKSFHNVIWHGLEALLRYKENESKLELIGRNKIMGVEYYLLDVTDKQNRKTRFYISTRSLRVMMLEYEDDGVKYRRKFYDYNISQGTLVPYRTVLWANDRQIEETEILTITFGQRVEEDMFRASVS